VEGNVNYFLITKDNAESIMTIARRLTWDDAEQVMAIIKDLKPVRITNEGKEDKDQEGLFKNKFSGTGDRNEGPKEERDPLADALVSGDKIWGGDGTPVY